MANRLPSLSHKQLLALAQKELIPPLSSTLHKGQAGRVCIIGGSRDYTGAPYFCARATALMGMDLVHVVCPPAAAPVIKGYSPDLMVHPILGISAESTSPGDISAELISLLQRMHAICVGPGLGRDAIARSDLLAILRHVVHSHDLGVVLDADALWFLAEDAEIRGLVSQMHKGQLVLTPNIIEARRIAKAVTKQDCNNTAGRIIASQFKCVVIEKGAADHVHYPDNNSTRDITCRVEGSLKRVGGQGDTLAGAVLAMIAYSRCMEERQAGPDLPQDKQPLTLTEQTVVASYAACSVARECSRRAFSRYGRAMQTSNLSHEVGAVFHDLLEREFDESEI
ncbi:hypothetical protein TBLA_0A10100 [Henningerozyma blattae CBS 6284]|uniref:ATP-dependent (S)-NAD(P)H-hydrate dehydratase n=1 Tax=Henningerozyma blattae (strain ATCC 34711 / CBS 6284 / DSM 70876 / NBRC 10599 / NRRL Y-10934 / UCD 77-7) TaxID=1071380 RepID=I2GXD8_HENB6|nr:hypothetical protein TBLA_0A10100 [Tetrapisispora blattae CBS 6284]CCH58790.1 hypothetical protein TBLA_0A10100 [Tetrapisispora blattae CBS 6284]